MRFFTPELLIRFNSSNDRVADRADAAWEKAIRDYRSHLAGLRDLMPPQVKKLSELSLHDAEVLASEEDSEPSGKPLYRIPFKLSPGGFPLAMVGVRQESKIVFLIYRLAGVVRNHQAKGSWPFSKQRLHWLYDEIDVAQSAPENYLHRVLFSDGTVLEIPFQDVSLECLQL
jgi:hypothetical protein